MYDSHLKTVNAACAKNPAVHSCHTEDGEVWISLKEGFVCFEMECGTIHEATARECLRRLADVVTVEEFHKRRGF